MQGWNKEQVKGQDGREMRSKLSWSPGGMECSVQRTEDSSVGVRTWLNLCVVPLPRNKVVLNFGGDKHGRHKGKRSDKIFKILLRLLIFVVL